MKTILKLRTLAAFAAVALDPAASLARPPFYAPIDPWEVVDISYYDQSSTDAVGYAVGDCTPSGATNTLVYGYRTSYEYRNPRGICENGVFEPYNYG